MNKYRELLLIVVIALALRLAVMTFLYSEQLSPARDHWQFGYETGRIARSIVEGKGFSNPLFGDTGPTAWMTPVYTYLIAGIFKIFGVYTKTSALVLLSINALISASSRRAQVVHFSLNRTVIGVLSFSNHRGEVGCKITM